MALGKQGGHAPAPTSKAKVGMKNSGGASKGETAKGKMPKSTPAGGVKPH